MIIATELIEELRRLEESLWITEMRFDLDYMEKVFTSDFFEFGRSGRLYTRKDCLGFERFEIECKMPLEDFRVHALDNNSVFTTYTSEVQYNGLQRSFRSSIWIMTDEGWKLKFHQGTPVAGE